MGWVVGVNSGGYGVSLHTTDGGAYWLRQETPAQIPDVTVYDVCAVSRNIAPATGADGLIPYSTDGGTTWVRQAEGVAPPGVIAGRLCPGCP